MPQERCAATETISLVSRVLNRSKPHLQSMLSQNNSAILEDFFRNLVSILYFFFFSSFLDRSILGILFSYFFWCQVDSVPDLIEHINRTSARALLHINGYNIHNSLNEILLQILFYPNRIFDPCNICSCFSFPCFRCIFWAFYFSTSLSIVPRGIIYGRNVPGHLSCCTFENSIPNFQNLKALSNYLSVLINLIPLVSFSYPHRC